MATETDWEYNPGSEEAEAAGCLCPVMDNNYGRGAGRPDGAPPMFWLNGQCPLHGIKREGSEE